MRFNGRSSEATGLVYAHRNPRNPFKGDPTVAIYHDHTAHPTPTTRGTMNASTNGHSTSTPPTPPTHDPAQAITGDNITDNIAALRHSVNSLRGDGLDDEAIAAIAGLNHR